MSISTSSTRVHIDTRLERLFGAANYVLLSVLSTVCFIPFVHVIAVSLATPTEAVMSTFLLIPRTYTLSNYMMVLGNPLFARSLFMSFFITSSGVLLSLVLVSLTGYPLSISGLRGRRSIMLLVLFTMLFNAGILPNYLLIRSLGLLNNLLSVIVPSALNAFYLIIAVNFFKAIPSELRESAHLDGAHEVRILVSIMLPLSKPILATLTLFYAVNYWNMFLPPLLYLTNSRLWPVQVILRQIVVMAQGLFIELEDPSERPPPAITVNMTVIALACIPIMALYPFVQKHFAKGIMLGSVKG
jgi:putative aldouronate transport system permease protein